MKQILFRVDGNSKIGLGHIIRCIALAEILKPEFEIEFVIQQTSENILSILKSAEINYQLLPEEPDIEKDLLNFINIIKNPYFIVLDGYNFKSNYQKALKRFPSKVLLIDDYGDHPIYADYVLNHSGGISKVDYKTEPYTKIFHGSEYALIRKEFLSFVPKKNENLSHGIALIGMGGADPNNVTLRVLKHCYQLPQIKTIQVLVGAAYPHLADLYQSISENPQKKTLVYTNQSATEVAGLIHLADVVICPASGFSLEVCAVRSGLLIGYTFDNQLNLYKSLTSSNCGMPLNNLNELKMETLQKAYINIMNKRNYINQLDAQQTFLDCKSPERILEIFTNT